MDNRETLTPSSGDAILKRHLFSELARNWIKGRGHIERAYFVRRPSRQSFGFRVAASSGPIPKAPGSAGGYLPMLRRYQMRGSIGRNGHAECGGGAARVAGKCILSRIRQALRNINERKSSRGQMIGD